MEDYTFRGKYKVHCNKCRLFSYVEKHTLKGKFGKCGECGEEAELAKVLPFYDNQ